MTQPSSIGGPVSAVLEAELRDRVRRHGIVVWLDLDDNYSQFVDRLVAARKTGDVPYEIRALRGSLLSLMLSLEGLAGGTEKVPLVIHLPGFNMDTVRDTPIFELYEAGVRFRKALDTLITEAAAGRVRPDQIDAFKEQSERSLEDSDAWLAALLEDGEGGLAAQLRAMQPTEVLNHLLAGGPIAGHVGHPEDEAILWDRLAVWTGLPATWQSTTLPHSELRPEDVAFVAASWALCVEYVDDLERAPVSPLLSDIHALPSSVIETCCSIASYLREHHVSFYRRMADEMETLLTDEVEAARAEDLGKIDTFRFEEAKVLDAALEALAGQAWDVAAAWAGLRLGARPGEESFWLRDDPSRLAAWELLRDAAEFGRTLGHAGEHLMAKDSLEGAVDAYMERGAAVDQAHRHLEQRRVALLYPQVPRFETLRSRLDDLRRIWRQWADTWATEFNTLCRDQGFVPASSHQQRALFDEVVRPMTREAGATALFVVDALRFEMGEELYRLLVDTPATAVHLRGRLAELPTVTEVGMNVLAPVAKNGRLRPALSTTETTRVLGFSTGEFRVSDPETRRRAMHDRVGGGTCPGLSLEEVVRRDSTSLKRAIAQARLVVVHSQEIDQAGENGIGPAVFDHVMQKLRAAWKLLRDAGVRRFVFTSDHGFLLLDESTATALPHGRRIDPKRRHVFSKAAADHTGEVRVELKALGYDGAEGHVMFPETTAVFDTGRRSMSFVHGGNSLQERVIPVLTLVHRAAAGGSTQQYRLTAKAREDVAGMHCIEGRVEVAAQRTLDFSSPKDVELSLRVLDVEGVQVELCQTRGDARIVGGAVRAAIGSSFELFFRLSGTSDARVRVELHHPSSVDVKPCTPDTRFFVAAQRASATATHSSPTAPTRESVDWLEQLPDDRVRRVFEHLAAHGTITEAEATPMLGGPRALRRFSRSFEEFQKKAPFSVHIDVVAGVKRYVREGSKP